MLPVTEAFMKTFESYHFECKFLEAKNEDRVHVMVSGDTFGTRYLLVRFPHEGDYVVVMLPEFMEIPKGKNSIAVKTINELHRTSLMAKFWADKSNRNIWAMLYTYVRDGDPVATATDAMSQLMNYCNRAYPLLENAFQNDEFPRQKA